MSSPPSTRPTLTGPWLLGLSLVIFGLLTLFLVLGWFFYFEVLALAGGFVLEGLLLLLYARTNPNQNWAGWAGYLVLNIALFFGVGFLFNFGASRYLAWAAFLLGVPFMAVYVRQVWYNKRPGYWWTVIPAGILITLALAVIQFKLGWPVHMRPGIQTITFMGGVTGTLLLVWLPTRDRPNFGWLIILIVITALLTGLGILILINMVYLAPPLVLMGLGGYFLISFLLKQWQPEEPAAPEAPGLPPPTTVSPIFPQVAASSPTNAARLPAHAGGVSGDTEPHTPTLVGPAVVALPAQTLTTVTPRQAARNTITLISMAFGQNLTIPRRYTCDGDSTSPPLEWLNVPKGAESLVIICDTPDSPQHVTTHWLLYNLSARINAIPAGIPNQPITPEGAFQGLNDFKQIGYDGPCPPPGKQWRYFFQIYALDINLPIGAGATRRQITVAMDGHIIAQGQLVGVCQRRLPDPPPAPPIPPEMPPRR
jgi:Raf kinase inhibitor-like YbhB/YbcL family protein